MISVQYMFFLVNAFLCLSLIFLVKRKFDFISIYTLVLFLYTLPLFFGNVVNVYSNLYEKPDTNIFVIMALAYSSVSIFIIITNNNIKKNIKRDVTSEKIALNIFFIFSIIGFILFVPTILSSSSKVELLENSNLISAVLYSSLPVVGFLLAIKIRNKKFIIIFSIMLVFLLLFGARRSIAIACIGAAIIILQNNSLRLIAKYRFILTAFIALILVVLSKTIYGYTLIYGVAEGLPKWFNDFDTKFLITGSEFLNTSAILNSVIINDFTTDKLYYFYSFLALQPIPLSYFNYSSSYFNDVFQPELFPGINYGLAYNIWAEAYSAFGYLGIFFISLFIPFVLNRLWVLYCRSNNVFSVIILTVGIVFAFWIQRNSLATIFAYTRNIFYPLILIYLLIYIVKSFFIRSKN